MLIFSTRLEFSITSYVSGGCIVNFGTPMKVKTDISAEIVAKFSTEKSICFRCKMSII